MRGASLGLFASDPDYDYAAMIDELADRGATDLLVVVPLVQDDLRAHGLDQRPGLSPSPEAVARTLDQARARGLRLGVLPIVRLAARAPGEWRGVLAPAAGPERWFEGYTAALLPLVDLAESRGAVWLGVGSELGSLEPMEAAWRALIARVRARFSGRLFYAANWDRVEAPGFWDALDAVGVSAYFELAAPGALPDDQALAAAWVTPRARLQALAARTGKPLLLAEVGYPAHALAAARPWDHAAPAPLDLALQARLWAAFCEAFAGQPRQVGFYAWNWFGQGGPRDRGYTPRGKPAAATLAACWARPEWDEGAPSP